MHKIEFTLEDINVFLTELGVKRGKEEYRLKVKKILSREKGEVNPLSKETLLWMYSLDFLTRFSLIPFRLYKDNVSSHQERVAQLIQDTSFFVYYTRYSGQLAYEYNRDRAKKLAKIHDVIEWVSPFGDIATPVKIGLSPKSKLLFKSFEEKLISIVWEQYINLDITLEKKEIQWLMQESNQKETFESQLVSYLDKIDAFMLAFHEASAWNKLFIPVLKGYSIIFKKIQSWQSLPLLQPLFLSSVEGFYRWLDNYFDGCNYTKLEGVPHLFDVQAFIDVSQCFSQFPQEVTPHTIENTFYWEENNCLIRTDFDFWLPGYLEWKVSVGRIPKLEVEGKWCNGNGFLVIDGTHKKNS